MIMWEVATLDVPWGDANPFQLIGVVINGGRLEVPSRSELPGPGGGDFEGYEAYVALLRRCWAQSPFDRPTFSEIIKELRSALV
jgi:hypothetical protein